MSLPSISPSEIPRITATDDCPPEFPPVPISIGTNRMSTAGSAASNFERMVLEKVAETISKRSQGILAKKRLNAELLL